MEFSKAMGVTPGITALIGSGGKTSLQNRLAAELRARGVGHTLHYDAHNAAAGDAHTAKRLR